MLEYCNGIDLAVLLRVKKVLTQEEVRLIMNQVISGICDVWELNIIHRDMKLANILLNFPDNPEVATMSKVEKKNFLADLDLTQIRF